MLECIPKLFLSNLYLLVRLFKVDLLQPTEFNVLGILLAGPGNHGHRICWVDPDLCRRMP